MAIGINLKSYNDLKDYAGIFKHNFGAIDNIGKDELFERLLGMLAKITKLDYEVILSDLKRYIMFSHEYSPGNIRIRPIYILLLPYLFVNNILCSFPKGKVKTIDIIIDDCAPGPIDNLYGKELIHRLLSIHDSLILNFRKLKNVNILDVYRYSLDFIKCFFYSYRIARQHKIDLRRYIFSFFSKGIFNQLVKNT